MTGEERARWLLLNEAGSTLQCANSLRFRGDLALLPAAEREELLAPVDVRRG